MARIGIRHEDKSRWEARAPLTPAAVQRLIREEGVAFTVQQSPTRAFTEAPYEQAGAAIAADLGDCPVIMGVKEIPPEKFEPHKTYVFFSHTIKGQPENMPMLRRLMELKGQLIDYEKIVDEQGRRLVFFGRFAGLAGMIDTLWALGQRLRHEGIATPFETIRPAHEYSDLEEARRAIRAAGEAIAADGLPEALRPFICGFAGYGQVSQGAQEIFDLLPVEEIAPQDLHEAEPAANVCGKVVFREEDMVKRIDDAAPFDLQEYYDEPDKYRAAFFPHAKHLSVLVNCIYWEPKYPRMITREQFAELYSDPQPRLRVVGDITCDIDGSVACTTRATDPSNPVYVYDPKTGETEDGVAGRGPVVLAVDFLPCELPVDASEAFSEALLPFIGPLARADLSAPLADSGLPPELVRATIVYHGALTEPYQYLEEFVK
ncbi:MAG: bifunctional lysine ketoglutarate reductase /saccharopine dehydrogenase family protein [Planctomycetota bacterium]|nr:bifunctional lysine ketoglutarate reductase /saccharopine dehydrogenase family protein [Planctomycetota bacterium]